LNIKSPVDPRFGSEIVIVGASVYPKPAFVILIAVMVPAALTTAVAAAETVEIPVNVIVGEVVYPDPLEVSVTIPTTPSPIDAVAAAPLPPPPINLTNGAVVYP
jgi:hypothetical protein